MAHSRLPQFARAALLAVAVVVLVALAADGYWLVWRPRHLMREVGVDPEILSARHCENYPSQGIRRCDLYHYTLWGTRMLPDFSHWQQVASFHLPARTLWFLERRWTVPDSLAWARAQDSVSRAMTAIGAQRLTCDQFERDRAFADSVRRTGRQMPFVTLWRLPDQDVRVSAYDFPAQNDQPGSWMLEIQAVTTGPCRPPAQPETRLMTPEEMSRAFQEWLEHEIGF